VARKHYKVLAEEAEWPLKAWFEYTSTGRDSVQVSVQFFLNPTFSSSRYFFVHGSKDELYQDLNIMEQEVSGCVDRFLDMQGMSNSERSCSKQSAASNLTVASKQRAASQGSILSRQSKASQSQVQSRATAKPGMVLHVPGTFSDLSMPAASEDCNSMGRRAASESPEKESKATCKSGMVLNVPDISSDQPMPAVSKDFTSAGQREAAKSPEHEASEKPKKETCGGAPKAESGRVQSVEARLTSAESLQHNPSTGLALIPDSPSMPNLQGLPPRLQQRTIPEPPGAISVKQLRRSTVALKKLPRIVGRSVAASKAPTEHIAATSPRDPKCLEGRALRVLSDAAMEGLEPSQSSPLLSLPLERRHYGGVFKHGRFERNRATTLDQLTEAQKQEIRIDLEEQRRRKVEELMRRQKSHAARQQREQQMEARRVLGCEHSRVWSQAMSKKVWGYKSSPSLPQDGKVVQYFNQQAHQNHNTKGAGRARKFRAATTADISPQRVLHRHVHHHMHFHEPNNANLDLTMLPDDDSPSLRSGHSFRANPDSLPTEESVQRSLPTEESVQSRRPDWFPALEGEETPRRTTFQQVLVDN